MQRVESFGLRGHVDHARADRVDGHRRALAADVQALRAAHAAGKTMVPAPPKPPKRRDATPRTVNRSALPLAPASAIERRRLGPGLYRLPEGGTFAVGEAICAAQVRDVRVRAVDKAARLVETAIVKRGL